MREQNRYSVLFYLLIFILSHLLFPQNIIPQIKTPIFENISIEQGLPENSVTCILQDYLGYLWFGTQNGLVKYDGYSMEVFNPEENNPSGVTIKGIVTLFEDKNKTLWIGTLNGLFKFNRADESFNSYKFVPDSTNSINSNKVHSIYEDSAKKFWVGTQEGLNLLDRANGTFTRYYFSKADSNVYLTKSHDKDYLPVNAIIEDPISGDILIGTDMDGLWKLNSEEKKVSKYNLGNTDYPDKKIGRIQSFKKSSDGKIWMASFHTLSSLEPQKKKVKTFVEFPISEAGKEIKPTFIKASVIEDKDGLIWCGFYEGEKGIFCLNPETDYFQHFTLFPDDPPNNYSDKIFSVFEDHSGIIYIGTWGMGVWKWDRIKNKFMTLKNDPNNQNSLSNSVVNSLTYDRNGFFWFSTLNGLDKFEIQTGKYYHYLKKEPLINKTPIYACISATKEDIWLGTTNQGLIRFNPENESYKFYFNNPKDAVNLANKPIIFLIQDHLGFLWIGTDGFGLFRYDITNNKLTCFKHDPNDPSSLTHNQARALYEDQAGTIWIGTNLGGLNKFDRRSEKFIYCGFSCVLSIHEDKKGNFWVGDYFSGLNVYDRNGDSVIATYNNEDGLASNSIWGILEDNHNNLWIKTDNGLLKFNMVTKTFKHYTKEDGLVDNFFSPFGLCKSPDGTMFFNAGDGLVVFHPDSIKDDLTPPEIVLSGLSLFDRPGEKLKYDGFISELKEITLPHNQNNLRFDFVGLHYSEPFKNQYKYLLENFDDDWVAGGTQRNATYTNLDPGEYIFRVTASNRDGVWNEAGTSIKLIILPPWWKTWWAYLLYTLTILSIFITSTRFYLYRQRLRQKLVLESEHAEKLEEIAQMKSDFFTNISHEFRTPLTLILGPVKQVIEKIKDTKIKEELSIVHKNANNLLGLVNQLLDISKLESGNMKLKTFSMNVIPFLKALVHSFSSYAERKNINLRFNSQENEIIAYIDKDKVEKIIVNILSNAFKFTPEGGWIEINVRKAEKSVDVSISDSGIGIPKEKILKVFDRFYQVDGNHKSEYEGTGIGLALTKELVGLHHGKIAIESVEGKGTTFIVSLPLGNEHLKPEEICDAPEAKAIVADSKPGTIFIGGSKEELFADKRTYSDLDTEKEETILIVEDNTDVRNYIKSNLENDYRVMEAIDGEDGWNNSVESLPDIIVSDVMMPKMNGFTLLEKLKTDERTSHIPVILLTARAATEDKIEGYKTGADAYIMKPFDTNELKARIKNLIEQRKRIQQHFQRKGIFDLDKPEVTSVDKKFLRKAFDIITQNISDPIFSVESFAENMAISRYVLYKKIVSLTGETPVELIRRIRLQRAAELIEKKFGNLSEVALEVGFNNPAYFSDCFKKQFGVSPSHYPQKSASQ